MRSIELGTLIGFVGIVAELAGALMLVSLFAVLRRYAARRPYFAVWGWAWLSLVLSIAALAVRYLALVDPERWIGDFDPRVRALYFVYQFGKMFFYGLMAVGTLMYVRGVRAGRVAPRLALAVGALAVLTTGPATGLSQMVQWHAPVAVGAFAWSAALLFSLPRSRRSLGSHATAGCFLLLAGLWVLYFAAFGLKEPLFRSPIRPLLDAVLTYNSYLDLLLHILLGYGMVLLLMEDRQREADDAHAVLAAVHDQLRREALYDALTGALNRRAYGEGVGLEWANATYGAVAMVDVDDLKLVNDRYGHPVGDELLRRMAEVLRGALRASDKLYRWGGDEFLVLLPAAQAEEVVPRLRATLASAAPLPVAHAAAPWRLEASLGAANYVGAESLERAIARADRAMYEDKQRRAPASAAALH